MPTVPARLEKERACLVVIDMQEQFRNVIQGMPSVVAACSRLIHFCDRLRIPMLVTEHYPRGLGSTLAELRHLFRPFEPLEKITFSCAQDDDFRHALESLDRPQTILCGIETHVCVYQTAFDLLARGRQVAVATDGVSSRRQEDRRAGLQYMQSLGTQNMSCEMIMFEILRRAKTEDFKLVADILKES